MTLIKSNRKFSVLTRRVFRGWLVAVLGMMAIAGIATCELMPPEVVRLQPLDWRYHPDDEVRSTPAERTPDHLRVLFIGNSYTERNGGQARILRLLAASRPQAGVPMSEEVVIDGASLREHWELNIATPRIHEGNWDYVVLQEFSTNPLFEQQEMIEYGKKFDQEIRKVGAKTVLFMTWPREGEPEMESRIDSAYEELARQTGASIVPAALAWRRALKAHPKLRLYERDGSHPLPAGSYLTSCLFYAMFYHASPLGLTPRVIEKDHAYFLLNPKEATQLQQIAAEVANGAGALPMLDHPTTRLEAATTKMSAQP